MHDGLWRAKRDAINGADWVASARSNHGMPKRWVDMIETLNRTSLSRQSTESLLEMVSPEDLRDELRERWRNTVPRNGAGVNCTLGVATS